MSEGQVQSKKIKELEAEGYYVIKLMKTNKNGIPDLIALKENEAPYFIEVKTNKGTSFNTPNIIIAGGVGSFEPNPRLLP